MLEENKKKQSIIKKIDYILIAFQIIIAVALGVKLFTMGVVPIIYLILYNAFTNMENVIGSAMEITSGITGFSFINS